MITNFALSLSSDGIELLHRVPRGWRRVGHADVGSKTLEDDLKALREKALIIEPDGLRTKLVIPLDQIKYLAIDSTQTTQDDIDAALEGQTPYALDELVVDCERFGGRTHIAAVARETLEEAEAFAAGHGFQPVCFVAVPEPFTFQKEVFFGPTSMARDIVGPDALIERDDLPVLIVGTRIKSRLLVFDLPEDVTEDVFKDDLAAHLSAELDQPPTMEKAAAPSEAPPAQAATVIPQPVQIDHIPPEHYPPSPKVEPAPMAIPATVTPAIPVFAQLALLDPIVAEYHAGAKPAEKALLVADTATATHHAPKLGAVAPPRAHAASETAIAHQSTNRPALIAAGLVAGVIAVGGWWWAAQPTSEPADAPMQTVEVTEAEATPTRETAPAEQALVAPEVLAPAPDTPTVDIAQFGALTDGLPTTAPALSPASLTPFSGASAPAPLAASTQDSALGAVQPPPEPPEPAEAETAQASLGAPVLRGQVPSPDEAASFYAATGVWQRAPRLRDTPKVNAALTFDAPATTATPSRIPQPQVPPLTGLDSDLSFLAPANPPSPDQTFARDADGFIAATPEGTLTPEGAVVIAGLPDLTITPRPELTQDDLDRMALLAPAPEGVVVIAGRPDVNPPLRPADARLPQADPLVDEQAVEPATHDAPTPGGVGLALLEAQDTSGQSETLETASNGAIIDLRPRARPTTLSAAVGNSTPDITDILAGIATDDATLRFEDSTALAVVLSLRPSARPSGFDNVVVAAMARAQTQPAAAPVRAAAPVAPQNTAPVPGGVAQAATQEGAIRLRDINLIGVYGRSNARRALVRLSNGSYVRVEVGSALDGGQVTAIGDDVLNYVKRGRTYAIDLPGEG